MSRDNDGVDDSIDANQSIIRTSYPLTLACWFSSDNTTGNLTMVQVQDSTVSNAWFELLQAGGVAGKPLAAQVNSGAGAANAQTTTGYKIGKWHFATATFTSATQRSVYIDAGSIGSDTVNRDPFTTGTMNSISIARRGDSTPSNFFDGRIAYVQVFNRILDVKEIRQIMFFPGSIKRNLIAFYPLYGTSSPEQDYSENKLTGTVTGTIKGSTEAPINGIFQIPKPELLMSF